MGMTEQEAEVPSTFLTPGASQGTAGTVAPGRAPGTAGTAGTAGARPAPGSPCLPAAGSAAPGHIGFTAGCCSRTRGTELHVHVYTYMRTGYVWYIYTLINDLTLL